MMTERVIPHETLAVLCAGVSEAVVAVDQNGHVCLINSAAETAFAVRAGEVVGHAVEGVAALGTVAMLVRQAMAERRVVREEVALPSGETIWVRLLVAPEKEPGVKGAKIAVPLHVSADPVREIVHDFQARISAIKHNIDLIEAAGEITDKQKTFAQRAHLILSSMLIQVYEILDMSWLEMSGQLNRQPTDLNEIARRAVMHLEDYAQRSEVDITLDLMDGGCFVEGDERRLGSAVGNLVSNAIKYSPNGGPVRVAVRVEDDQAIVRVEDQGIGIPAEHLATLFQWFVRIRTPETRRISGTGLGLAIVKAVVEKHGGNVFAESVYGEGSSFGFSLPLPPRPNPRRRRPEKTASRGKRARSTAPAAPQ